MPIAMLRKCAPVGMRNRLCTARVVISKRVPPGRTWRRGRLMPYIDVERPRFLQGEAKKVQRGDAVVAAESDDVRS